MCVFSLFLSVCSRQSTVVYHIPLAQNEIHTWLYFDINTKCDICGCVSGRYLFLFMISCKFTYHIDFKLMLMKKM